MVEGCLRVVQGLIRPGMARYAPVTALLRILGVELMARLGRRLPAPAARALSALMLVGANLLPLWAVLEGRLGMGDVLLVYWFENVVVWFTTTVKLLTTTRRRTRTAGLALRSSGPLFGRFEETFAGKSWVSGDPAFALFFAVHFGIFTLVHGMFTAVVAGIAGLHGSVLDWVATTGTILLSHILSVGLNWFGRRERAFARPGWVMAAPYPRMLSLHLTVILGFFFLGGPDGRTANDVGAVALLVVMKTVLDLVFHVAEHLILARQVRASERPPTSPATSGPTAASAASASSASSKSSAPSGPSVRAPDGAAVVTGSANAR